MKASDTKKPYEKAWMNRVEIAREWVEYKDDLAYPSLIKDNPGYIREARRGLNWDSFDDRYQWPIIDADKYQHFYRDVFYHKQHNNYVSMDQHEGAVGPIIWSIESKKGSSTERDRDLKVLVQSKKGVERVTIARHVIEDTGGVVPAFKQTLPAYNKLQFTKLSTQLIKDRLLKYEDQIVRTVYKFGVLYCKEGQTEEDEMYNNRHGSPAFDRFLDFLGDRVKLEGFTGYRGGLDVKTNTTGTHSVHTTHIDDCEIMFHVSTLLQYFPADPQQVERKRHLGNDVVLIIFRDKGDNVPFNPKVIRSQFNHIFAVFEEDPELSTAKAPVYRIEIGCKDGVMPFGPDLPNPPLLTTSPKCRRWLLSKLINSERAAYYAPDFLMKFRNTRKAQLQAIIEEALSAAPKKSLSLGRKTGSSILKGASKMMTVRRSKDAFNPDSFQISKPFDYRHEAHLDNSGSDGASFGALLTDGSFLDLMKSDEAAGILPICTDGGKRLTKATSFDDKMASQLIPRSARPPLSSSPSETSSTLKLSSTRKSAIHAPPAKPLPPPGGSTPSEGRKGSREGSSPAKKEEERTAIYGLSPISLSGSRPLDEDNRDDDSASASGWVVGTFHTGDEPEPKRERHHQAPPPKPGGVGAVPHKPKRATDVAFERPNKPPPPPPGGSDAKPQASRRRRPVDTEKRRPPPSVDDGARKSHSGSSSSEPNGSESLSSSGSGSSSRRRSGSTSTKDDDTTHRSGDTPEEKRRSRPPSSPRGERGEDRIGRRRTMGTASGSPRSRASVQGAFDSPSPSPKPGRRSGSSPRHNGSSQQAD